MNESYMRRALELAKLGAGRVSPNPMVGAVIVKNGEIIGEGYHKQYGGPHAEVNAIASVSDNGELEGSTIYVTLEPCCHYGKTPPCTKAIIDNKIKTVVIGTLDPNPLVAGKGVEILRAEGIEVIVGVLEEECLKINESFMKYIKTKTPFVIMKAAMTLDGKIATSTGDSKWITNEESRINVHKLRNKVSGIMVGINTVLKDDPELTCRLEGGASPKRIIVDSGLKIPLNAKVLNAKDKVEVIVATTRKADESKVEVLERQGVKVIIVPEKEQKVNLKKLMEELGNLKVDSVLLEGGGTLCFSALEEGIIDKVQFYIAPKIIGGENSKTPVEGVGINKIKDAINVKDLRVSTFGGDILIEGYIRK
ncbi:bifunctional diaminohydroxyphosphoribosylaminopyrimidine deaminase/5-amino-6-(5-phosphoribosylamino)uracil reductase RibD [Clostridium cellulovorans]|uniref:Riboflavin biosynthesis protein RibD n=1 Tax=Clostridium cellulovorans (strain ATCC 35296 / DSM 3052 / OCM 3 / 743B) TaxID=573061 RepID=D9SS95_CLOC7|nr:bifunctional diaminohydroxyphosphoribosylaminopyrimidine deaminase/5-amino-6-(5-phosphoribosylamino)uracil reductase RibD [Clostridium cellulovorans]ADL52542.1 riboflavin biosynthesis protein RibD [Clostridium cellulovorans 743B]